jgi:hypothetical protein
MGELSLQEWRERAANKLDKQAARALLYQHYYDGEHAITALLNTEERQTFRKFLRESKANWCELVVNAVAERLQVVGFRFGADSGERAWTIWQASSMDADGELAQTDALVCSSSFVLVQPEDTNPTGVEITGESPFEATVLYEPGRRRRRTAGYKRFADDDGATVEVLILPDVIATWQPGDQQPDVAPNPALQVTDSGFVPLVEIRPQPRTIGAPRSELGPAITFQDRINTTIFNRMVATDYGAFRQIWATGVKMARKIIATDDDGTPVTELVKPYDVGANRLLANENPEGRFGSFPESTLAGYLNSVAQDVQQLAAVTQTPPHYLLGEMVNLSADAIKAAETGLVAKVSRRALHIGEAWEEVMRIALGFVGDPAAVDVGAEVIWKDFETRSEGQRVDALVKMSTLGVPTEVLWQRWGATPQEIEQWKQMQTTATATTAAAQAAALGAADPFAQLLAGGAGGNS